MIVIYKILPILWIDIGLTNIEISIIRTIYYDATEITFFWRAMTLT